MSSAREMKLRVLIWLVCLDKGVCSILGLVGSGGVDSTATEFSPGIKLTRSSSNRDRRYSI